MNLKFAWSRRSFLSALGAASGGLFAPAQLSAAGIFGKKPKPSMPSIDGSPTVPITTGLGSTGDIYAELGVTPLVNINGTVTVIGGSVMKPEVMELIRRGNEHFVLIDELEIAAGKFIAKLCKSPAGYTGLVTGGAAAAMVVGYAGMMTEDLEPRMRDIPDVSNFPRNEVIIQKSHRYPFDHQIRQTGAKLVEVETREEMIAAINPKTVAIHFTNILSDNGKVSGPETVEIAKAHNIYTFNDAAADVPPKERLWEYPAIGFDMVTFSGGKDIRGPQASGVLIGREELIHYSLLNMSPQEDRIGRCCKVGKETIFGLLKALEMFVNQDFDAALKIYDERAQVITDAVKKVRSDGAPSAVQSSGSRQRDAAIQLADRSIQAQNHRAGGHAEVGRHQANRYRQHGCWCERYARTQSGCVCGRQSRRPSWPSQRPEHFRLCCLAAEGWRGQDDRGPLGRDLQCSSEGVA